MGLFQFLMPLAGWAVGNQLAHLLASWERYVAAGLLAAAGLKMLLEAWRSGPGVIAADVGDTIEHRLHLHPKDPTRGWSLLLLSLATSIDALVVGCSLGLRQTGIWRTSLIIGLVAGLMALGGVVIGKRIGDVLGRPAEFLGGVVLIALSVSFLWWG